MEYVFQGICGVGSHSFTRSSYPAQKLIQFHESVRLQPALNVADRQLEIRLRPPAMSAVSAPFAAGVGTPDFHCYVR